MNFYADYIRNQLSSVIENMEHQSEKFVKNPGHDFTRNRKMNFISTIETYHGLTTSKPLQLRCFQSG